MRAMETAPTVMWEAKIWTINTSGNNKIQEILELNSTTQLPFLRTRLAERINKEDDRAMPL